MIERAIGLLLLNALWEPIAVALCAFAVLRVARKASAATRCAVLTTAIVAALVLPLVTTAMVYRGAPATAAAAISKTNAAQAPKPIHVVMTPVDTHPPAITLPQVQRPTFTVPPRIVLAVVGVWSAIALVLLMRLLISFGHLARLRRNALPLSPVIRDQLQRWSEKAAGIEVRLCLSDETVVPIAVGLFDCMVLIPRRLVEELEPADLDRIVLHEIAHLRRHDGVVYAVQQLANALYYFSPGVVWLSSMLDVEREVACDDWVLERGADAAPYANCLVRLAEGVPWPHKALAAPGAFVTRHSMSIRIERILQKARDARLRAAPMPVLACTVAAGIVAAVGLSFAPSLAYPIAAVHEAMHMPAANHVATHTVTHTVQIAVRREAPKHVAIRRATSTPTPVTPVAAKSVAVEPAVKRGAEKRVSLTPFEVKPQFIAAATPAPVSGDDYIDQMRAIFGSNLSVEDLVSLKSVGVTPQYVQQLRNAGFPKMTVHGVIAARATGITTDLVAQYRQAFGNVSFDDMIAMASMRLGPAYRSQLQAAGLKDLNARQLIALKSVGVTPDYIKQVSALGFGALDAERLLELKSMNIDRAYLDRVRAHGFQNLTIEQLIQLKASGVIK